jgi:hypothetical protein
MEFVFPYHDKIMNSFVDWTAIVYDGIRKLRTMTATTAVPAYHHNHSPRPIALFSNGVISNRHALDMHLSSVAIVNFTSRHLTACSRHLSYLFLLVGTFLCFPLSTLESVLPSRTDKKARMLPLKITFYPKNLDLVQNLLIPK